MIALPARATNAAVPAAIAEAIVQAGRRLDSRGWVPATAGNISQRMTPDTIAITRSGIHKGYLASQDIIAVGRDGAAVSAGTRPSAETLLHCQLYQMFPDVHAVLHGHSIAATVLSMQTSEDRLQLSGYEVQKVFDGQSTHLATIEVPILDNDQDISRIAAAAAPCLGRRPAAYMIRGHGTYVWGPDMPTALARFEGLEFLLGM